MPISSRQLKTLKEIIKAKKDAQKRLEGFQQEIELQLINLQSDAHGLSDAEWARPKPDSGRGRLHEMQMKRARALIQFADELHEAIQEDNMLKFEDIAFQSENGWENFQH